MRKIKYPEEQFIKWITKWADKLNLQSWSFVTSFSQKNHERDRDIAAEVCVDPVYQKAYIVFFPCILDQLKSFQEESILHELVHCLVRPVTNKAWFLREGILVTDKEIKDADEHLVQKLTRIIKGMGK